MATQIGKQEVADKIQEANNILIITSGDSEIDQLSSCIALFDILQALDKKAVMVYSGSVSSALTFLKPDKIIREDAESLRDFIISFEHSKVDKFRYTKEDDQYNILLTPAHRAVITEEDIQYCKGDFNIDLTVALGIVGKGKVDSTISQHAQLMQEIPMINIVSGKTASSLEVMTWKDETAAALSEMIFDLSKTLDDKFEMDKQTANAVLIGIVDQTERYKSRRTRPETMHISGELLELGADPHLVAENLALASSVPVDLPEAVAETKVMVDDAVGEAGQYDTQLIQNKKKKKSGRSQRLYIRAGESADALSYGQKAEIKKAEEEHKLDQLSIDKEGNLRIVADEETEEQTVTETMNTAAISNNADMPASAAAPGLNVAPVPAAAPGLNVASVPAAAPGLNVAPAPASSLTPSPSPSIASSSQPRPTLAPRGNVLSPSSNIQSPHPAIGAATAPPQAALAAGAASSLGVLDVSVSPTAIALAKEAGNAQQTAPSISDMVNTSAAAKATSPLAAANKTDSMNQYIESLSSATNPSAPSQQPAQPAVAANQALSVDNLTQQQAPGAAPNLVAPAVGANPIPAPNLANSLTPPIAPPLPSAG